MGRPLYTNNAATYLAFGITNTATTMQVSANAGSLFPNPTGGDYFYVSLISLSGPIIEIVKCTARSGDIFTIERGQEGTSALYWNMGDNVQLRITAAGMNYIAGSTASTTLEQSFTATQGQTVFTLTNFDYSPGNNNLAVFVNGSKQVSGTNYTETNVNTVTFTTGLNAGDIVEFLSNLSVAAGTIYATDINYNEGSTGAVTRTLESKLQEQISVLDFGADPTGATDSTLAIQKAHNASVATGLFPTIYFPAGIYKITSLNWSPYVSAQAEGAVRLETNLASGVAITVSTQYGVPPLYIYNSERTCVFNGQFVLENNYGSTTTAIGLALGDDNFTTPTFECATSYFDGLTVNYFYTPIKIYNNCHDIAFNNCIFSGNYGPQFDMTDGSSALVNTGANMTFYNCFFAGSSSNAYANQYLLSLNTANTCDVHFTNCGWAYLYGGLNNPDATFNAQGVTVSMTDCHHEFANDNPNTYLVIKNKVTFDIKGGQSGHTGANTPASPFWSNVYIGGHLNIENFQYVLGATTPAILHNVQAGAYGNFDYVPNYYQSVGSPNVPFLAQAGIVGFNGITRHENISYTPTWTASVTPPSIGNGSISGNYTINGNQVTLTINFIAGSTTTYGAGVWSFRLPLQAESYTYLGDAVLNGTSNFYLGTPIISPAGNTLTIAVDASPSNGISAGVPFTWASGNTFQLQITYTKA